MKSFITSPTSASLKLNSKLDLKLKLNKSLRLSFGLLLGSVLSVQSLCAQAEDVSRESAVALSSPGVNYGVTARLSDTTPDSPSDTRLNLKTPGEFSDSFYASLAATDSNSSPSSTGAGAKYSLRSSHLQRYQVDQGTRMTGWQLGDGLYFGRSKGELKGVALIWQRSQTAQVSLSGNGLRLTRRIN